MRVAEINERCAAFERRAGDGPTVVARQREIEVRQMAAHVRQMPRLRAIGATGKRDHGDERAQALIVDIDPRARLPRRPMTREQACSRRSEMIGNKAGINDSIVERRIAAARPALARTRACVR